jgi:hypothetical protein
VPTDVTVAVNAAALAPVLTVTEEGTATFGWSVTSITANPPLGAGPLSVTLQLADPGVFTLLGVQARPLSVIGAVSETEVVRL